MTDSGSERPRRAMAPEGAEPDGLDDTRHEAPRGARRGAADDFDRPFARPADPDSATSIPAPVLPETERRLDPLPPEGQRASAVPRRSAASTTSPGSSSSSGLPDGGHPARPSRAQHEDSEDEGGLPAWLRHHRRTLLLWGGGAVAAAVLIAFAIFNLAGRSRTEVAGTPSASTSSEVPLATASNLLEASEATTMVPEGTWTVVYNIDSREGRKVRPVCLGKDVPDINPVVSLHRSLGAEPAELNLGLIHEIDGYANVKAATDIYQKRLSDLAACSINQVHIVGATSVEGMGDEAVQVTVAVEDTQPLYQSILLVRTGRVVSTFVVKRADTPIDPTALVTAATTRLQEICSTAEGTCPGTPAVAPTLPPPVDPVGWLIPADLPRIQPGVGKWVRVGPDEVTLKGIGCENMALDTDPGPQERLQTTFVENENPQTPEGFGLDELRFTFPDEGAANTFESALVANIASCSERANTATVSEYTAVSGVGVGDAPVAARMFSVSLEKTAEEKAYYQLIVTRAGATVSYVLVTVSDSYQFSEEQLGQVAIRAAQRASQA